MSTKKLYNLHRIPTRRKHSENQIKRNNQSSYNSKSCDLIVFCHLHWEFDYQRPQPIISRLVKDRKVLFVEEPSGNFQGEENLATIIEISPQLPILQPRVDSIEKIPEVFADYLANVTIPIGWFYSAAFIRLIRNSNFWLYR